MQPPDDRTNNTDYQYRSYQLQPHLVGVGLN